MKILTKKPLKIVDLYDSKVDDKTKYYLSTFSCIDSPPQGLMLMEDVIQKYDTGEITSGTYLVSARCGDLYTDLIYNRGDNLRYNNQKQHIVKLGGFSYDAADTLSVFLRPNCTPVLTKGNNRTSMRYACGMDPDSRVVVSLKLHPKNISFDEMIRIESVDHNTDCNYRTNQTGDDKFKSAFYAKEGWAVELHDYLLPFDITVANIDETKFIAPSHSYLSKARREAGDQYTSRYLKAFTENECSHEVLGNAAVAGAIFLKQFSEYIDEVDRLNQCDSFSECLNFWYNKRADLLRVVKAKNLTQSDLTTGNGVYKGDEPTIARYVFIYNEYCRIEDLNHNKTYATSIPLGGEKWKEFVNSAPVWMQGGLTQMAETQFVV
jgi:hypothetical protein